MANALEILTDTWILIKLLAFNLYCYLEVVYRNLLPQQKSVQNDIVLITGAAGGIGRVLVKKFLQLGSIVVCVDYDKKALDKLKDEVGQWQKSSREDLKKTHYYVLDLASEEDIRKTCERIKNDVGMVNVLVNNAGIVNQGKLLLDLTSEEIKRIFQVNTFAHFWLCKEFLPDMIERNRGHIVNVASVCGLQGAYKLTDYCSSKFAVVGFTESLRNELKIINANNQIQISLVCPFHVKTKLFDGVEFSHWKWAGFSMSAEAVGDAIVNGILTNKDLIFIPKVTTTLLLGMKNLVTTKFADFAQKVLDLNGSMDKLKGNKKSE